MQEAVLGVAFPFGRQPGASGDGLGSGIVGLCCGPAQRPENEAPGNQQADERKWLKAGDVFEMHVPEVGTLKNTVQDEKTLAI